MLKFFVDSDCDFTLEDLKEIGADKIISMPYSIDGNTTYPYEDFEVFDGKTFYDSLRDGTLPTTSAVNVEQYIKYIEPVFEAGDDIFYPHFSRAMSTSFNSLDKALEILKEKYPTRKCYLIDTKGITVLSYLIIKEISKMLKNGKSVEEIMAWAETEVNHFAIYFFADDLKFFKRSGRVTGLAAMMGTLVGIRPIIYMDEEGKMLSIGKARGRMKAMDELVSKVKELGDNVKEYGIVIGHTDSEDIALEIADMLKEEYGEDLKVEIKMVNPTAGSHCGPNGVGIAFHSIHR